MKIQFRHPLIMIAALGLVGVLIGVLAVWSPLRNREVPTAHTRHESSGELVPPAGSVEALVAEADVILVGTIDSLTDDGFYAGYVGGTLVPAYTSTPPSMPGTPTPVPVVSIPYMDFEIDEELVLKEDPVSAAHVVRMIGRSPISSDLFCDGEMWPYPPGNIGDRFAFFLSQNPDGSYGLLHGPYDRIDLEDEITYTDCPESAVPFADGMDEQEFIDAIATEVAIQN